MNVVGLALAATTVIVVKLQVYHVYNYRLNNPSRNTLTITNHRPDTVEIWIQQRPGAQRVVRPLRHPRTGTVLCLRPREQTTLTWRNIARRDSVCQVMAVADRRIVSEKEIYFYGSYGSRDWFDVH